MVSRLLQYLWKHYRKELCVQAVTRTTPGTWLIRTPDAQVAALLLDPARRLRARARARGCRAHRYIPSQQCSSFARVNQPARPGRPGSRRLDEDQFSTTQLGRRRSSAAVV